jgi:cation diffusion facilitator CzcD-associated flavoprotein CzcO
MNVENRLYHWAIIGAGPAGIAALGKLLDAGILASEIIWLDSDFKAGDLGKYWFSVEGNTKVKFFIQFLNACSSFHYSRKSLLFTLPLNETCQLSHIVEPLKEITHHLSLSVNCVQDWVISLQGQDKVWNIQTHNNHFQARNVILATGSEPTTLQYEPEKVIPLHTALNEFQIGNYFQKHEQVAVFGYSHSAVIILKNLIQAGCQRIVHFYQSPPRFAIEQGNETIYDNTGLKGKAAEWTRAHLVNQIHPSIQQLYSSSENIESFLPHYQKIIYATGFKRRRLSTIKPHIEIPERIHHGIIAPGLFGVGIGYPNFKTDAFGYTEAQVGLWKFMDFLTHILPLWLAYSL